MRARLAVLSLSLIALVFGLSVAVGHADPPPTRRSLDDCLEHAERNYPGISAARHKIAASEAQLQEAWVAPFLNFNITGFLSFAPEARGNPTFSPDRFGQNPLAGDYGYIARASVDTGIPISPNTWIRLGYVRDAARMGIRANEGELARARLELRTNVRKAYYGLLLARDGIYLLDRARGYLNDVQRQVDQGLDGGTGTFTQVDLARIRLAAGELRGREGQVHQAEHTARAALGMLTGYGDDVDVLDQPLCPIGASMFPLAHYLSAARLHRPEVGMLRAGVTARRLAVSIQRGAFLPDLAVGLTGAFSASSSIADQSNPFAANNSNYAYWGAGLVLRWNFEPLANIQRVNRLQEELAMTEAQERQALGGIALEVESNYEVAREAENRVSAYTETEDAAYMWFTTVFQEYQSGIGDAATVLTPLQAYLTQRYSHLQAIFDYNVARATLALSVGSESLAGAPECPSVAAVPEADAGAAEGPSEEEINAIINGASALPDAAATSAVDAAVDVAADARADARSRAARP